MMKKLLNQNANYEQELINSFEPNFSFHKNTINRFKSHENNTGNIEGDKIEKLFELKKKINSIENCNLRKNSKNLIFGHGDINRTGFAFQGDVGELLKKMLIAINIKMEKIYLTYSINFRIPEDKKPSTQDIKRYSKFLKEHISIINPKILVLMGSTAMETVTGMNNKISDERGKWRELISNNVSIPIIITFSPSYLIRFPENKKYSWEDLKKIKKKIQDLNINI